MALIKAECTNCGGTLEIDAGKDAAICPHCGSAFVVEKAINQYITNHQTINKIENAVIQNGFSEDKYTENGITQLKLEKYQDAQDTFRKMSQDYPNNWKSWVGLSVAENGMSHKMKLSIISDKSFIIVPEQWKNFIGDGKVFWEDTYIKECEEEKQRLQQKIKNTMDKIDSDWFDIQQNDGNLQLWKKQRSGFENIVDEGQKRKGLGKIFIIGGSALFVVGSIVALIVAVSSSGGAGCLLWFILSAIAVFLIIWGIRLSRWKPEEAQAISKVDALNRSIKQTMENNRNTQAEIDMNKAFLDDLNKQITKLDNDKEEELSNGNHITLSYYIDILEEKVTKEGV